MDMDKRCPKGHLIGSTQQDRDTTGYCRECRRADTARRQKQSRAALRIITALRNRREPDPEDFQALEVP